jgi:drug/metabolite transporter (DMT)-like permease
VSTHDALPQERLTPALTIGTTLVLAASIGFAWNPILARLLYDSGGDVFTVVAIRWSAASLLMLLLLLLIRQRPSSPRRLGAWLAVGIFNACASIPFWIAVTMDDVSSLLAISYTAPVLVVLLSALFLGERLTIATAAATALALTGLALVVGGPTRPASGVAAALAAVAAISSALYYMCSARAIRIGEWYFATTVLCLTGALLSAPAFLFVSVDAPAGNGWLLLLAVVIGSTVLPFSLYLAGANRIGASRAAILAVAEPVLTVVLAVAILDERLGWTRAAGLALVVASCSIVATARRPPTAPLMDG